MQIKLSRRISEVVFACAIFLSAFLLFQVQPLISKAILPWFGGSPAVWTTCMLFFQLTLLVGYAYAHFISDRLTPRQQVLLHLMLVLTVFALLPITPNENWKPHGTDDPMMRIVMLLALCVGLPYFVLSANGPLLQRWFSHCQPGVGSSPYRLYALSNVGSLLALISYPFVVEPGLSVLTQAQVWSWSFVAFGVLCFLVWNAAVASIVCRDTEIITSGMRVGCEPIDRSIGISILAFTIVVVCFGHGTLSDVVSNDQPGLPGRRLGAVSVGVTTNHLLAFLHSVF